MKVRASVVIILMASLLLPVGLFATGQGDAKKPAAAGTPATVLSLWSWRSEDKGFWDNVITPELKKRGMNIELNFRHINGTEYNGVLDASLQAGEGPDIITLRRGAGMQKYADAGILIQLDGTIDDLKSFGAGSLRAASSIASGRVYGVPFAIQPLFIFYNTDIFSKYGISVPKTWDELLKAAQTLKQNGVAPFFVCGKEGWSLSFWHYVIGASALSPDWLDGVVAGKNKFTDPQFVQALNMLAALVPYFQANYMGSGYEDMRMGFAQGAGAMMMDGVWSAKYLTQSLNPNLKFSVFPCPPLTASGKPGVFTYVDGSYGGNVKTKYPDKVIAFLKFAATKDFGQMFSTFTGEITAVPGVSLAMSDKPI
jgi:raffinose/stachyose/melibiose transport system substrate-binding protein